VREIGSYEELMAKPNGLYKRLETLQSMDQGLDRKTILDTKTMYEAADESEEEKKKSTGEKDGDEIKEEVDQEKAKINQQKAKNLAQSEMKFFLIGSVGAILHGIV
jgi:hypothetical protein